MPAPKQSCTAFHPHDHQACIDTALATAKQLCIKKQVKLTHIREQVLTILLQEHRPRGAYSIINALAASGARPAPTTVYRALDFLLEHQLIHSINTLSAFIACCRPARRHQACFLICQQCKQAEEINAQEVNSAVSRLASQHPFMPLKASIEVFGICSQCTSID
jgi:Fur family zinc uptake transcriptional regulator